jgi:hypothetical protein
MGLKESLGAVELVPKAVAVPGDDERIEGFSLEPQEGDNWCWAAVTVSVARHLNSLLLATQCLVVEAALPCDDCHDAVNDMPGNLVTALSKQHLTAVPGGNATPSLDIVLTELHQEQPVICQVQKDPDDPASMPHFVVIVRAHRKSATVKVLDPGKDKFYEKRWGLNRFVAHCQGYFTL